MSSLRRRTRRQGLAGSGRIAGLTRIGAGLVTTDAFGRAGRAGGAATADRGAGLSQLAFAGAGAVAGSGASAGGVGLPLDRDAGVGRIASHAAAVAVAGHAASCGVDALAVAGLLSGGTSRGVGFGRSVLLDGYVGPQDGRVGAQDDSVGWRGHIALSDIVRGGKIRRRIRLTGEISRTVFELATIQARCGRLIGIRIRSSQLDVGQHLGASPDHRVGRGGIPTGRWRCVGSSAGSGSVLPAGVGIGGAVVAIGAGLASGSTYDRPVLGIRRTASYGDHEGREDN
jgi:hypothetical protein